MSYLYSVTQSQLYITELGKLNALVLSNMFLVVFVVYFSTITHVLAYVTILLHSLYNVLFLMRNICVRRISNPQHLHS